MVELKPGGGSLLVNGSNRTEYCDALEAYRLTELSQVADAVRRGLLSQLPPILLTLVTWQELESMVCGNPNIDMNLLRSATEYRSAIVGAKHSTNHSTNHSTDHSTKHSANHSAKHSTDSILLTHIVVCTRFCCLSLNHESKGINT